jgi:hypothetical protein
MPAVTPEPPTGTIMRPTLCVFEHLGRPWAARGLGGLEPFPSAYGFEPVGREEKPGPSHSPFIVEYLETCLFTPPTHHARRGDIFRWLWSLDKATRLVRIAGVVMSYLTTCTVLDWFRQGAVLDLAVTLPGGIPSLLVRHGERAALVAGWSYQQETCPVFPAERAAYTAEEWNVPTLVEPPEVTELRREIEECDACGAAFECAEAMFSETSSGDSDGEWEHWEACEKLLCEAEDACHASTTCTGDMATIGGRLRAVLEDRDALAAEVTALRSAVRGFGADTLALRDLVRLMAGLPVRGLASLERLELPDGSAMWEAHPEIPVHRGQRFIGPTLAGVLNLAGECTRRRDLIRAVLATFSTDVPGITKVPEQGSQTGPERS